MDRWQYLLVLGACVLVTLPLELLGGRVYRRPLMFARAVLPVAVVFVVWDAIATVAGVWDFNPRYLVGVVFPGGLPLEEVAFFVVIPLCAVLTYGAVEHLLAIRRRARAGKTSSVAGQ